MDDLGALAGEMAMQVYGPLIDHIGQWCLGLVVLYGAMQFAMQWWQKL